MGDPFGRFEFKRRKVNIQAILAFVVGIAAAYVVMNVMFDRVVLSPGLFGTLIVLGVGGLWYHIRRVV